MTQPLADLARKACRWPVNTTGPDEIHLFCGAPCVPTKPYCAGHCALAYRKREAVTE